MDLPVLLLRKIIDLLSILIPIERHFVTPRWNLSSLFQCSAS